MSAATLTRPALGPVPLLSQPDESGERLIVVPGTGSPRIGGPVLAALDDDGNAGAVLRQAAALAARLRVALRAAYVWSDCRPPDCPHHRRCRRDLDGASRLVADLVERHLSADEARRAERDIVHDSDPVRALVALSVGASMLVVGSSSDYPSPGDTLGDTSAALLGATRCPVAVVPHHQWSATTGAW